MENVFETKVKEKKQKLKDSEHELTQKHKNVSCSLSVMVRAALLYGIGLTFFALVQSRSRQMDCPPVSLMIFTALIRL